MLQKYLRNKTQELKGNIRVFWRVRPIIPSMDDPNDIAWSNGEDKVINIPSLAGIFYLMHEDYNDTIFKFIISNILQLFYFKL